MRADPMLYVGVEWLVVDVCVGVLGDWPVDPSYDGCPPPSQRFARDPPVRTATEGWREPPVARFPAPSTGVIPVIVVGIADAPGGEICIQIDDDLVHDCKAQACDLLTRAGFDVACGITPRVP